MRNSSSTTASATFGTGQAEILPFRAPPEGVPGGARVRLGVLTNPTAKHNFLFPFTHGRLIRQLESTADAVATADKSQIDAAVRHLLIERDINVLAINGGDGTIHGAINAIAAQLGDEVRAGRRRLPTLLLLNGGTYNMASRAMGTKGDPVRTVESFLARYRDRTTHDVTTRTIPLLDVRRPRRPAMLGLVFGSQVIANVLALCDRLGSGYPGLARLLWSGVTGHVLQTEFYRGNQWRLAPQDGSVRVDGRPFDGVTAAVVSTIDLKLAKGFVWALTTRGRTDAFHVKLIRAKSSGVIVRLLPNLLWELPHPMILSFPEATSLSLAGNFTVDGELYEDCGPVDLSVSTLRFDIVSGEGL